MEKGLCGEDVVIVSPKNSGIKRARNIAEFLNAPIAIIDYAQDDSERSEGYIIGDVAGKKLFWWTIFSILVALSHKLQKLSKKVALLKFMQLPAMVSLRELHPTLR